MTKETPSIGDLVLWYNEDIGIIVGRRSARYVIYWNGSNIPFTFEYPPGYSIEYLENFTKVNEMWSKSFS